MLALNARQVACGVPLPPIGSEGNGQIAQLVEHEIEALGVLGSIPSLSTSLQEA